MAVMCCALQVCIDLFVLSQAYTDIATLSTLSHTTGGSLYHYCPFTPLMDQDQLLNDLKWNVSRPQVGPTGSGVADLAGQHSCA
jgi:protein transport protein SEC24